MPTSAPKGLEKSAPSVPDRGRVISRLTQDRFVLVSEGVSFRSVGGTKCGGVSDSERCSPGDRQAEFPANPLKAFAQERGGEAYGVETASPYVAA
jgi:hypothetical protein